MNKKLKYTIFQFVWKLGLIQKQIADFEVQMARNFDICSYIPNYAIFPQERKKW